MKVFKYIKEFFRPASADFVEPQTPTEIIQPKKNWFKLEKTVKKNAK
jgi:hypothetical protein